MKNRMVALTAIIFSAAMGWAQTTDTQSMAGTDPSMTGSTDRSTTGSAQSGQIAPQDELFVKSAAEGGLYEVQSSQLAATKADSDEVKQFARKMVEDHTKANEELKSIASSAGIKVPTQLGTKEAGWLKKLQETEDADDFDELYGRQQGLAHLTAVGLFEAAAQNLENEQLKAFAQKTLPVLRNHAQMVKDLPGADEVLEDTNLENGNVNTTGPM